MWQSLLIKDFKGIESSSRTPSINSITGENFDLRGTLGDVVSREGFYKTSIKNPSDIVTEFPHYTNVEYLSSTNAIYLSDEFRIDIYKAKVLGHGVLLFYNQNAGFNPSNSTFEINEGWLNRFTSATIDDRISGKEYQVNIELNSNNISVGDVAYNISTGQTSMIVKYSATNIFLSSSVNWGITDDIIICKNYIDMATMAKLYNAQTKDISYHTVLGQLRIGFGGYDRQGLSISYQNQYLRLKDITNLNYTSQEIENFAKVKGLILSTYNGVGIQGTYGIQIDRVTDSATLLAGTYIFRLTGMLDGYSEVLLSEQYITTNSVTDLKAMPKIDLATVNKRITKFNIYVANQADGVFYYLNEAVLFSKEYNNQIGVIDVDGKYLLDPTINLHNYNNAVKQGTTDYNSLDGWTNANASNTTLEVVSGAGVPYSGTYAIKMTHITAADPFNRALALVSVPTKILKGQKVKFTFYAKGNNINGFSNIEVMHWSIYKNKTYATSRTLSLDYQKLELTFTNDEDTTGFLLSYDWNGVNTGRYCIIDNLKIEILEGYVLNKVGFDGLTEEMSDKLGYTATSELVIGWDQALQFQGKILYINPFIDKRYQNKICTSVISSSGTFMYDVGTIENYFDLESFDENNLIGCAITRGGNCLVLKENSCSVLDVNSGRSSILRLGAGCINKNTIVNFGEDVAWLGIDDIYVSDGLNVQTISEGTIREEYRGLDVKENQYNFIATKEYKDNAFKFCLLDKEYLYTKRGWVKFQNPGYVKTYLVNKENKPQAIRDFSGTLYLTKLMDFDEGCEAIPFRISTPDIDISHFGSQLKGSSRFYIKEVYFNYNSLLDDVASPITVKVYIDNTLFYSGTATNLDNHYIKKLRLGTTARSFRLEISCSDVKGNAISIHSIGLTYKILDKGRYAKNS